MMKRVCSACKQTIGYKAGVHGVTHGLCVLCERAIRNGWDPHGPMERDAFMRALGEKEEVKA